MKTAEAVECGENQKIFSYGERREIFFSQMAEPDQAEKILFRKGDDHKLQKKKADAFMAGNTEDKSCPDKKEQAYALFGELKFLGCGAGNLACRRIYRGPDQKDQSEDSWMGIGFG